jgi:hypothetical protein
MARGALNKNFPLRRIFLRVPVKSTARVFAEQELPKEVDLNDISSGGISFYIPAAQALPDYVNIEFHLEPAGKAIKAKLAVTSRVSVADKSRVGCSFFEINEADKNHITQYICKLTNLVKPLKALALATFLCYIDALWRIPAYFLYCRGVEFERLAKVSFSCRLYFFILLLYAGCAACGFILSGRPVEKFGKLRFLASAGCLIGAFIFLATKAAAYLILSGRSPLPPFLDIFIWIYVIFAAYIGYAVILTVVWAKKIDATSQILERHSSFAD